MKPGLYRQKPTVPKHRSGSGGFSNDHLAELLCQPVSRNLATQQPPAPSSSEVNNKARFSTPCCASANRQAAAPLMSQASPSVGAAVPTTRRWGRLTSPRRRHRVQVHIEQYVWPSLDSKPGNMAIAMVPGLDFELCPDLFGAITKHRGIRVDRPRRILGVASHQGFQVTQDRGRIHPARPRTFPASVVLWPSNLMNPTASSGVQSALCA